MATLAELEQSYQNQNVRNFLKIIAEAEGVKYGYNTLFGNSYIPNLAQHPNTKVPFTDKTGKLDYSTASGAYQFLYDTWERLKKQFGFKDFGGRNQDLGAIALIAEKGALNDVKAGNYRTAINKLGGVWASLPSSQYKNTQPSKTWEQLGLDEKSEQPTGIKKWFMAMPSTQLMIGGILAGNTIMNHEDGVLAGAGQVAGQAVDAVSNAMPDFGGIVDSAGNFALRAVVILSAVAIIAIGFYFMFKQEITNTVKAVTN